MSAVEQTLSGAARAMSSLGVRWCLVGGFAVSARTIPRFTRDLDVAVAVQDDAQAERLTLALRDEGFHPFSSVEHDARKRLATVRLRPESSDAMVLDLLFASSGIEQEVVNAAERLELLPGVEAPVARLGHLIALKLLARDDRSRPQDLADLNVLLRHATTADRQLVAEAIELIHARGYARDKDLRSEWSTLAAQTPSSYRP